MQGTLLAAAIQPDNTPHGYNLTFAFPMLMFIIVAGVLYLRFRSSHRVPGHVSLSASRWAGSEPVPAGAAEAAMVAEVIGSAGAAPASADAETQTAVMTEQAGPAEQSMEGSE